MGIGYPGGDPNGCPYPRRNLLAAVDKDGAIADISAVNGETDGSGCAGIMRCPIPGIWQNSPRPP